MLSLKALGEKPGFFPGFLSFCLPGLGQMYQRRYPVAALGVLPFWFLLAKFPGYPWPLLLSAALGWEAYRWSARQLEPARSAALGRREQAFAVTAIGSFCFWAMLVHPAALKMKAVAQRNANAWRNQPAYRECVLQRGKDLAAHRECDRIFDAAIPAQ